MSRRASGRLAARVRRPVAAGCRLSGRPAVTPAEAGRFFPPPLPVAGVKGGTVEAMQVKLIDENRYADEMRETVLPALATCRSEGWMAPADDDGLPPLQRAGKLHYVCYDAAKFDRLSEDGAAATFRGAVVISHGFTEFAAKYAEMVWYFLLAGYSVCVRAPRTWVFRA